MSDAEKITLEEYTKRYCLKLSVEAWDNGLEIPANLLILDAKTSERYQDVLNWYGNCPACGTGCVMIDQTNTAYKHCLPEEMTKEEYAAKYCPLDNPQAITPLPFYTTINGHTVGELNYGSCPRCHTRLEWLPNDSALFHPTPIPRPSSVVVLSKQGDA